MTLSEKLSSAIRDVPDFPKKGIVFKDITPIMLNAELSNELLDALHDQYKDQEINAVAGIESRGFLLGYPLAMRLGVPFILIRKAGKLPYDTINVSYDLEYGSATMEMHADTLSQGDRVLVHDDLLATGGSATAAAKLIQKAGGEVAGFSFLVTLDFLKGREKLMKISDNISTFVAH